MDSVALHNAYLTQNNRPPLSQGLFKEQNAFDQDPSRNKAAYCSRRAGKTWFLKEKMPDVCINKPGSLVAYLTKTRDWAEELVWAPLQRINEAKGYGIDFHSQKLRARCKNGSIMRLAGAKDKSQAEVLRGFGYDLFIIDEAGSIAPSVMRYVVKEILPAALGEKRGTLMVMGTPNPSCAGYFHDITTNPKLGFSVHHWTQRENIMFPRWVGCRPEDRNSLVDAYLEEERGLWGYSETDPEYQREYLGLWARDEALFIFRIVDENVAYPPDIEMAKVLAIDLGWHDHTAFELVGYHDDIVYEIESRGEEHQTFDDIMAITLDIIKRHGKDIYKVLVDTAGAGKIVQESMAAELRLRCDIPCEAAKKIDKAVIMKFLNTGFKTNKVFLLPDNSTKDQLQSMQWDERKLREKESTALNDKADGFIYGFRDCYQWLHEEPEYVPEINTPEFHDYEAAKAEEEEAAEMVNPSKHWWER